MDMPTVTKEIVGVFVPFFVRRFIDAENASTQAQNNYTAAILDYKQKLN
jgi:hypothetical protein